MPREIWKEGLTEASVLGEELCELVTVVLDVAAVATVAVGRDADFGRAEVIGCHHSACKKKRGGGGGKDFSLDAVVCLDFSIPEILCGQINDEKTGFEAC